MNGLSAGSLVSPFNPFAGSASADLEKGSEASNEESFRSRFCKDWRVIPALMTLVCCILGVVYSAMWNYQYFVVPFTAGTVSAFYLVYLTLQHRNMRSLQSSATKFERQARTFENQATTFETQAKNFEKENTELKTQITDLTKTKDDLNLIKDQLDKELATTKSQNQELHSNLEKCKEALDLQNQLVQSLTNLEQAMKEDHTSFAKNFTGIADNFKNIQTKFDQNSGLAGEMATKLATTGESLKGIFTTIKNWLDPEHIQTQMKTQTAFQKEILATTLQLGTLQGQFKELTPQLEGLKKTKEDLENSVTVLRDEIQRLSLQRRQNAATAASLESSVHKLDGMISQKIPKSDTTDPK